MKSITKPFAPRLNRTQIKALKMATEYFGGFDKDLADAIGVSRIMIGKWRRGEKPVSLRCAVMIEKKTKGKVKAIELCSDLRKIS